MMLTLKEYINESYTFTFYKVDVKGKLSNKEELNFDELDSFLRKSYGKYANIVVKRSDGNIVQYTDNGKEWEKVKTDPKIKTALK